MPSGPRVGHLAGRGAQPGISAAAIALAPETVSADLPTCGSLTMSVSCATWSLVDRRCVREAERRRTATLLRLQLARGQRRQPGVATDGRRVGGDGLLGGHAMQIVRPTRLGTGTGQAHAAEGCTPTTAPIMLRLM